jgi:hypothetical protein
MAEERSGLLRLGLRRDALELICDRGEFCGRGRLCGLVGRRRGEFGLLAAAVVQARLEATQALIAALGCELALFERVEVALELSARGQIRTERPGKVELHRRVELPSRATPKRARVDATGPRPDQEFCALRSRGNCRTLFASVHVRSWPCSSSSAKRDEPVAASSPVRRLR